uniref:Uncharacterized protein n=1 Tax=Rhizophora mucronata TaxID=61149 RepID=A0A2P2R0V2_RHIMU
MQDRVSNSINRSHFYSVFDLMHLLV